MRAADGVVTPPVVLRRPRLPPLANLIPAIRQAYCPSALASLIPAIRKTYFSLYALAIPARSTTAEAHANALRANLGPKNGKALECAVMRFLVRAMSV